MKRFVVLAAAALALVSLRCGGDHAPARPPNFLIIVTDDQRYATIADYMPETQARIFDEGATFTQAFVTTPLCCPSRSSILTGMYAHNHGVRTNDTVLKEPTFVNALHDAGYYTGLVGKYLNSYDYRKPPRPEFDYWVATHGGGSEYRNFSINVNGKKQTNRTAYVTDVLTQHALAFIDQAADGDEPFMLYFAPNAPHLPATPDAEDEELYTDLPSYRPPSYDESDLSDKPRWLSSRPPLTAEQVAYLDTLRLNQLRSMKSVDRALAAILDRLEDDGELDNTVVVYISDNGHSLGEHRLRSKVYAYDFSSHVPFAVRYPTGFPAGEVGSLVANVDIAPTIYELAGLPVPATVDGRSLLDLMRGATDWRQEVLIESWYPPHYAAVRTERYLYINTDGDIPELYDYETDPYELDNRAADPAAASIVDDLQRRLDRLLAE